MKHQNEKQGPQLGSLRMEIGSRIKFFRQQKGLNQQSLADLMNISRTTVSKIENGKFAISIDYLEKFAEHLDFEIRLYNRKI